jgi:hypothetical protein
MWYGLDSLPASPIRLLQRKRDSTRATYGNAERDVKVAPRNVSGRDELRLIRAFWGPFGYHYSLTTSVLEISG